MLVKGAVEIRLTRNFARILTNSLKNISSDNDTVYNGWHESCIVVRIVVVCITHADQRAPLRDKRYAKCNCKTYANDVLLEIKKITRNSLLLAAFIAMVHSRQPSTASKETTMLTAQIAAISSITTKLHNVFAPMDARVLAKTQEWAEGRVQALREFKASDEYRAIRRNAYVAYPKLFEIAGGKSWYNVFNGRSREDIARIIEKHCASVVHKRNARIAQKLEKAGVT